MVVPKGWTKTYPKGNVSVSRDTEVKHSGGASVRFEILKEEQSGQNSWPEKLAKTLAKFKTLKPLLMRKSLILGIF